MKRKSKSKPASKVTQSSLAAQLGVSRQLIAARRKKPDAPELDDLPGWIADLAAHGRTGSCPPDLRRAITEVKLQILKETKDKLARENTLATRDSGELIPRELVEELLRAFGSVLCGALHGFEDCGQLVFGAKDPNEVRAVFYRAFIGLSFVSMSALRSQQQSKFPDWMLKSFCRATECAPWKEESYCELAAFACEYIRHKGKKIRDEFLQRLDAQRRWSECTDPVEKSRIWREEVEPKLPH